jgi:hypothetical protein
MLGNIMLAPELAKLCMGELTAADPARSSRAQQPTTVLAAVRCKPSPTHSSTHHSSLIMLTDSLITPAVTKDSVNKRTDEYGGSIEKRCRVGDASTSKGTMDGTVLWYGLVQGIQVMAVLLPRCVRSCSLHWRW